MLRVNKKFDPNADAAADAQHSAEGLLAKDTKRIYYKYCATFDSTDQGNIGPIGEALMETTKTDRVTFCPAFPEYSVTIFQGRMFLGGIMLGESGKRFDPVTPMTNSNLVEVLQAQSKKKVGLIPHNQLVAFFAWPFSFLSPFSRISRISTQR